MAAILKDSTLTLTGYVGDHWEIDGEVLIDGFTQAMVLEALGQISDESDLTVRINSGGGIATDGVAIRSALVEREGRTDVVIDGIAASAASVIAMSGQTIRMAEGAQLMIHDPSGLTMGTAADHERQVKALNSIGQGYARIYAKRSGQTEDACRDLMRAETWMGPQEAIEGGFADSITEDEARIVAAFPYDTYARAPQKLVAMARENGWRNPAVRSAASAAPKAATPAAETSQQEYPMTDKSKAGEKPVEDAVDVEAIRKAAATAAVTADRERRSAIMALEEAKGREALADHLYASTDMSVDAIKTALAAAPTATAKADPVEDYEATRASGAGLGADPKPAKPVSSLVAKAKARYATPE